MVNLRSRVTRLGVLDIGSNTIHMLIVDAVPGARPDPEASTKSKHPAHAVGTSKTFRSLARLAGAVLRQPGREDTWIMTREQLEDWIPRLAAIEPEQRVALPGITPERTMQIVGGGIVTDEIMRSLNVHEVEICPWALREGAILRWLDQFGRTRLGF
ncbi:Ppx/GppA phosphatase family protein [Bifidobacterium bifidum]|uniref:Ppx/GppA phosphatase family protein n=1 Tax=Bifidobacterium bifidum TaxID=1681 RepID=UPI001C217AE8|nr:hypothetical protein [Bifidobacterium bifidum]MBD9132108.1 hypothetical protein [Bifidobacterium bifidum]MBU8983792.1 hypothetical protein [Bifidobacterium bifidum]MBU8987279.1 hypothetical protein [Bifidobacterium bifidum]